MSASLTQPPKDLNFSKDVIHIEIEGTLFSGSGPYEPTEDNLKCYVQCWMRDVDGNDIFLSENELPYSLYNKKCFFDFSSLLRLEPEPPSGVFMLNVPVGGYSTKNSCVFYFKFADQYGLPAVPEETLTDSAEYTAIYGGSTYLQGFSDKEDWVLNSYRDRSGKIFMKEVRRDQPEFIYYYTTANKTVTLNVTKYYSDGSNIVISGANSAGSFPNAVSFMNCGYDQLNLGGFEPLDPDVILLYYKIDVTGIDNPVTLYYQLDDRCPDYDNYIAIDNGCGGIEMIRCSGKTEASFSAGNNIIYNKVINANTDFKSGTKGVIFGSGSEEWKCNTGYYSKAYCWHIRQMLLAYAWEWDQDRNKFYRIYITSTQIKLYDEADDLYYVEFTFEKNEVAAANTFNF